MRIVNEGRPINANADLKIMSLKKATPILIYCRTICLNVVSDFMISNIKILN